MATKSKSKTVKLLPFEKEQKEYQQELDKAKKEIEQAVSEIRKSIERGKQVRQHISGLKEEAVELKREKVIRLGKLLLKNHFVETSKICAQLGKDLKGYVNARYIRTVSPDEWKETQFANTGEAAIQPPQQEEMTEEEIHDQQQAEEYQQAVQEDFETVGLMNDLIRKLTGLDSEARGKISAETATGGNWRRELVAKTKDFRFEKFRKLTPGDVTHFLGAIQTLNYILEDSMIQLDTELERRKREVIEQ